MDQIIYTLSIQVDNLTLAILFLHLDQASSLIIFFRRDLCHAHKAQQETIWYRNPEPLQIASRGGGGVLNIGTYTFIAGFKGLTQGSKGEIMLEGVA